MSFSIRRKRLACVECTRRKVKCDKSLPCRNCIVKGIDCSRPRSHVGQLSVEALSPDPDARLIDPDNAEHNSRDGLVDLVEKLNARIDHLESTLKQQKSVYARGISTGPSQLSMMVTSPRTHLESEDSNGIGRATPQRNYEVEDAATILEFLAWGRRKDPKYQDIITAQNEPSHYSPRDIDMEDDTPLFVSRVTLRAYLQSLLPTRTKLDHLVKYHYDCLLWYHGSFHALVFAKSLEDFHEQSKGQIQCTNAELQWTGLLFAIILGSITCAPRSLVLSWGFNDEEREKLSHKWFKAMNVCLQSSNYTSSHSIFSVQAIATVTHSAHMLGYSNSQSVLLASAVRIAQCMGLHRLGEETYDNLSAETIDREIGRRVWCQLCTQDWFSIPFSESYLINRTCFDTGKPWNCNEQDMKPQSDDTPTTMSYSRVFYDIAAIMPQVQDAIVSSNTLYTRYEKILEYDQQLRVLATVRLPYYLQNVPIDPSWPCYVPWARRCLAISTSHKIIMIHRKFLGMSFVNPIFSRTRRTCVAAARTIIKELREARSDDGPVLWIHHAFIVAAGIILCLDMIPSSALSPEADEHRRLVQDGLCILSVCETNMIAKRGIPLLRAMLANEERIREKAQNHMEAPLADNTQGRLDGDSLDIKEIIRNFYEQDRLNFSRVTDKRLRESQDNQSSWPPSLEGATTLSSPNHNLFYELEFPNSFEDVLALAANYIS